MAYWFHRNVFKATALVNFETKMVGEDVDARKISSDLHQSRQKLLQLLPDANHSSTAILSAFNLYLSLLHGFVTEPNTGSGSPGIGAPSKLRHNFLFKWTHSLLGNTPQICQDTLFEIANMCWNVGIWHMKHASMLSGKDEISMDEAKEVHTSLRRAAGIFTLAQSGFVPQLKESHKVGGDFDPRVMTAYIKQCTAEAQEVTVARAVELKHNPSLISALANETSKLFGDAEAILGSLGVAQQWRKYLQLKSAFYLAYAYNYCGENLLTQDKCGEAISALKEAAASYNRAAEFCKEYGKTKGPAPKAHPEDHVFFKRLLPLVRLTLEKCERENGFIYHQKVPADPPELELKATYGLVSPEDFSLPLPSPLWTPVTYAAFDSIKHTTDSVPSGASAKLDGDLPPVIEAQVHQTKMEPKNTSGCNLQ